MTEHASLVNAMTCPSPTNPDITIFEDAYGRIPDLDALPTVGCFAVRLQEKPDRYDQKLDPINLAGVFLGFATFRGTYGSCILTDKQTIITARHHVAYDEDLMPRQGHIVLIRLTLAYDRCSGLWVVAKRHQKLQTILTTS